MEKNNNGQEERSRAAAAAAGSPGAAEKKSPGAAEKKSPGAAEKKSPGAAEKKSPGAAEKKSPGSAEKKSLGAAEPETNKFLILHMQEERSKERSEKRGITLAALLEKRKFVKDDTKKKEILKEVNAIEEAKEAENPHLHKLGYTKTLNESLQIREKEEEVREKRDMLSLEKNDSERNRLKDELFKLNTELEEMCKKNYTYREKVNVMYSKSLDERKQKERELREKRDMLPLKKNGSRERLIDELIKLNAELDEMCEKDYTYREKVNDIAPEQSMKVDTKGKGKLKDIAQLETKLSPSYEQSGKYGSKREEERKEIVAAAAKPEPKLVSKSEEKRKEIVTATAKPEAKVVPRREEKSSTSQTLGSFLKGGKREDKRKEIGAAAAAKPEAKLVPKRGEKSSTSQPLEFFLNADIKKKGKNSASHISVNDDKKKGGGGQK